jgi:CubicO group peptidase (beta-lactamase class C family)
MVASKALDCAFPDTAAGAAASAWLHAVNDAPIDETRRFLETHGEPKFLERQGGAESMSAWLHQAREMEGRCRPRQVVESSPSRISFLVEVDRTESVKLVSVEVAADDPRSIVGMTSALTSYPVSGEAQASSDDEAAEILDAYAARLAERGLFSGVVAVRRGAGRDHASAHGWASRAWERPNQVETLFDTGAMGTMFTAAAVAAMVGAGKLSFDDPVGAVWPDFPNRDVAERVTVHHLLSHTSGLGDYLGPEFERLSKDQLRGVTDFLPLFASKPLECAPGERFRYSNAGYVVLGGILERIAGTPFVDVVKRYVFAPAGMTRTDYLERDRENRDAAIGYTWHRWQRRGPGTRFPPRHNAFAHPVCGGPSWGAFTCGRDLTAFGAALLSGAIAPAPVAEQMLSSRGGAQPRGFGYGCELGALDGSRYVFSGGRQAGLSAHFTMFPEQELTIVALANIDPPASELIGMRARRLFACRGPARVASLA